MRFLYSLLIELRDADFGIGEDGADLEVAAQSPDVLRKGAYIKVGPALDPGDFALIRSEMLRHLGLRACRADGTAGADGT
jgi:hypothetical protein